MKFKKLAKMVLCMAAVGAFALAGCSSSSSDSDDTATEETSTEETDEAEESEDTSSDFDYSTAISVLSREDGSGTRGAFVELLGIEMENEDGEDEDMTTVDATITNNTEVMMTTVAGNEYAIGYCSLGSLNDSVKALAIDGVEATTENVANGTYAVSRPFNIVTGDSLSEVAQDFVDFILSADGQAIIEDEGYISVVDGEAFETTQPSGTISISGSSSVSPVMEVLAEAYEELNPNASIEIQTSDSTTGITNAIEGTTDIGMSSRDLKDTETGVTATQIASDGIAVIVNLDNPIDGLSSETIQQIYIGEITVWEDAVE